LTIALVDPTNVFALDDIKFMTGYNVEPVVASESEIQEGIERAYSTKQEDNLESVMASLDGAETNLELQEDEAEMNLEDLERAADQAPIVKLVNMILTEAVKRGASDIHLEPYEKEYRVRLRVDGILHPIMTPPLKAKDAITSRLKIMAKLDISEKRLPQDGRIMLKMQVDRKKKQLDFRMSTLPTLWGEKVVLRLLDKENLRLDMTNRIRKDQHALFGDLAGEQA
jgi:type IV pilus assembly protein PilB